MLKTSYFKKSAKAPGAVSIALKPPWWFKGQHYLKLAPTQDLLDLDDWDEYIRRYNNEILSPLDPQEVLDSLNAMVPSNDIILLCWEKDRDQCHRGLVAQWFYNTLGLEVPEVENSEKVNKIKRKTVKKVNNRTKAQSDSEIIQMIKASGGMINPHPVVAAGFEKEYKVLDIYWDIPDESNKEGSMTVSKAKKNIASELKKSGWEVDTDEVQGFFFNDGLQYSLQAKKLRKD